MNLKNKTVDIPLPTIRRIPYYIRLLYEFDKSGNEWISATEIGTILNLSSIQVRKDLTFTNISGKPKKGYLVKDLIESLEDFLGWNNRTTAVLIGAGSLGEALLGFDGFKRHGLEIIAAFDNDPAKSGHIIRTVKIHPVSDLNEYVRRNEVSLGVITVPALYAQETAQKMIEAGIKGIWNFSPAKLQVPDNIIVQEEDLSEGFAIMSVMLKHYK
jgi:redox-sensing transcriptional repressor